MLNANLAVRTGEVSGLVVLTVDKALGGQESPADIERDNGPFPPTLHAQSGEGDSQFYFKHPGQQIKTSVDMGRGLEIRADNSFIVAPPSVHISGHAYGWIPGEGPDEVEVADLPAWLLDFLLVKASASGTPTAQKRP